MCSVKACSLRKPQHHHCVKLPDLNRAISSRGQLEADKRASSDRFEDRSLDEERPAPFTTTWI